MERQDKDILKELKEIFKNINDWLKFAELKNGMIVVFNTTVLLAMISNCSDKVFYKVSVIMFSVSLVISLLSFGAKMTAFGMKLFIPKNKPGHRKNLLFFGDIASLPERAYVKKMYIDYCNMNLNEINLNKIEIDYAEEIITNSKIALYKYKLFNLSLIFAIIGVIFMILDKYF